MKKALKIIGGVIGLVVVVFLVTSAFLPRSAHVERSTVINGPREKVFAYALDLNNFKRWDPGLKADPTAQIQVRGSGVGAEYEWRSQKNGHGMVTVTSLEPPGAIRGRLEFFEPFSDVASVGWNFEIEGAGTRVTCTFDQEYPYLLRFLSLCMDRILGPMYEQSLASLKSDLEALPPAQ